MITTILTFSGIAIAGAAVLFIKSRRFGRTSCAYSDQYGNQLSDTYTNYAVASIVDCLDTAILSAILFYRLFSITLIQAGAFGTLTGAAAGILMLAFLLFISHIDDEGDETAQFITHSVLSLANGCLLAAIIHNIGLF